MIVWILLAVLLGATPAFAQGAADACGEIVLHNARITTLDARDSEASSVVIRGDRIVAVSTARGIPPHSACARVIDAGGRRVIPG
jgi:predicted amidohydrolase YtcJ